MHDALIGERSAAVLDLIGRGVFRIVQIGVLVFCLGPALLVVYLSFYRDLFRRFPPQEATVGLYGSVVRSSMWESVVFSSVKLAVPTAVLVVLMMTPAAIALERTRVPGRPALEFLAVIPLLIPATGYAVAIYTIYLQLGWVGGFLPLVLAEAVVSAPVAFLILRAALRRIPRELELVAFSLGASRPRAILDVSIRLLVPAMLAGALFSVVHVFDDVLYVLFLGGPGITTLSKAIFDSLEFVLDPVIAALSALFMLAMAAAIATTAVLRRGYA